MSVLVYSICVVELTQLVSITIGKEPDVVVSLRSRELAQSLLHGSVLTVWTHEHAAAHNAALNGVDHILPPMNVSCKGKSAVRAVILEKKPISIPFHNNLVAHR
jgi:hypothetical protein